MCASVCWLEKFPQRQNKQGRGQRLAAHWGCLAQASTSEYGLPWSKW
jgi:hypothetical protein